MKWFSELKYKEYFTMEIADLGAFTIMTSHLNIETDSFFLKTLVYTRIQKVAAGISKEHGCAFS